MVNRNQVAIYDFSITLILTMVFFKYGILYNLKKYHCGQTNSQFKKCEILEKNNLNELNWKPRKNRGSYQSNSPKKFFDSFGVSQQRMLVIFFNW